MRMFWYIDNDEIVYLTCRINKMIKKKRSSLDKQTIMMANMASEVEYDHCKKK